MTMRTDNLVRVASVADVQAAGYFPVNIAGYTLALFAYGEKFYAVDNRCPHMGFPLHRGTVKDGILTCHWHHARFDLASGGTFDQWADDVRAFAVEVRAVPGTAGDIWVDLASQREGRPHQRQRLQDGLERNISLVIAKSVISLLDSGEDPAEPFRIGLDFGVRYRQAGWGQGLTMHTCMMNLLPYLDAEDRSRALYHALSAVARDCDGTPPRFIVQPLPSGATDLTTLKRWFRRFIEVRDAEGAERCIVSALHAGAGDRQIADMLFAAATDHRYINIGHVLDFTNKALEALDIAGWEPARTAMVLTSLANGYANASRMEESNAWRNPIDLIQILAEVFDRLPAALEQGAQQSGGHAVPALSYQASLIPTLLGEDPPAIVAALLSTLQAGIAVPDLAGIVAYAAALRIAHFHTSNEFGDWDTALHTFTFANAVHQGLRRTPSAELVRGIFDAAMSLYLDRFLNIPPAPLPGPASNGHEPETVLAELPNLLDRQQQVDEAGSMVAAYLHRGGNPGRVIALLGRLLLREDRDFHTIQTLEGAVRQHILLRGTPAGIHVLVAAARYLAAHSPTMRAQGQTYQIAYRLNRGEHLFEE
ncbi:MAG: Rieske (2Fe-2S) protein [Chloroflexi bacterium]|nr:Rieske (2Fe-2S) protein [Chloroflexota bacterium]